MNIWNLPTSLNLGGVDWDIRTDFRVILGILTELNNPEYDENDKWLIVLIMLYTDFDNMPIDLYNEAYEKAIEFIDMGADVDDKPKPRLMDWEQDATLIIPAVNKVIGQEIRAIPNYHWWSFLSAYMEIGESSFSHILQIRTKQAKGKPLEKWEKEFIAENKDLVLLKEKKTDEEKAEEERILKKFFG